MSHEDYKILFSNLAPIVQFTQGFLATLVQYAVLMDSVSIGTVFIDFTRNMTLVYAAYCKPNELAILRTAELVKDKTLDAFFKVYDMISFINVDHLSYLIQFQLD